MPGLNQELAALIDALGSPWFFTTLRTVLPRVFPHDYLLAVLHDPDTPVSLIESEFGDHRMTDALAAFTAQTYTVDPIYRLYAAGQLADGVYTMNVLSESADRLAPVQARLVDGVEFDAQEQTGLRTRGWPEHLHETVLIVEIAKGSVLAISLYASNTADPTRHLPQLKSVYPVIAALVRQHMSPRERAGPPELSAANQPPESADVEAFFRNVMMVPVSAREAQIFARLLVGRSVTAIADELCLSRHTVITHRRNVYARIGGNRLVDLVRRFFAARDQLQR